MGKTVGIDGKVQAFDNTLLERLSRIHPAVPLCFWGPLSLVAIFLGGRGGLPLLPVLGWTLGGLGTWTLVEYVLHRWVFHWQPGNSKLRRWFYPVHQLHHDVQERDRIVAPLLMSVPLAIFWLGVFWLLLGQPSVYPFFGGFIIGYLAYDYTHFATHFVKPRTRIGKGLRRRHLQHHFACPDRWYGVSSPLWDYVFRTHVPRGVRPATLR
jgi:sterol desaturase/sphingolipid hydroxylase (fatty acid hydroxylase superfamily)